MPLPSPALIRPASERWGRPLLTGITLIAAVGFVLSYDALRQMAVAAHISGPLTYLFPLVIDGFIALGVTALLILRTAPLRSRLYVWTLVTLATGTSIWANALHAIRLNEQARLHLNNATVGALSATAPLALAGAVHLYLVINRHLTANKPAAPEPPTATAPSSEPPPPTAKHAANATLTGHAESAATTTTAKPAPEPPTPPAAATQTVPATPVTPATSAKAPLPATAQSGKAAPSFGGRKPRATEAYLLELARQIRSETGHVSRTPVENAARAQGYTVDRTRAKKAVDAVLEEAAVTKDLASTA
ncbi:DUF2637 domain-containing protein [Streptomyces sp. NPDC085460]|uniref:DUF2637 domain-containing protein n=1 Tax=Streptomyces sp. NPDC085460 TaxID=3365723 RepID=UPI0037CDDF96